MAALAPLFHRLCLYLAGVLFALTMLAGGGSAAHAATVPPQTAPAVNRMVQRPSSTVVGDLMTDVPASRSGLASPSTIATRTHSRSRIVDDAQILDVESRKRLTEQLLEAEARTESEFVVVTLPTIFGRDPKAHATNLFNRWRVGASSKNRGVLMLFVADGGARGKGRIEVAVWKGFNSRVSHSWTSDMLEASVLPHLRKGHFGAGFARCVHRLEPRLMIPAWQTEEVFVPIVLTALGASSVGASISGRNSRKCSQCGAICERSLCGSWKVVEEATDEHAGKMERLVCCAKCGATSRKERRIPKYDAKRRRGDGTWEYYNNSSSSDGGGGCDGGGGGGGDC